MIIKHFKKILSILLSTLFVFVLGACNGESYSLSITDKTKSVFYYNEYACEFTLTATCSDGIERELVWESSNPDVAVVNKNGRVRAISDGQTQIKVWLEDDASIADSFTLTTKRSSINVTNRPTNDVIDVNNYSTITLGYEFLDDSLNGEIEWLSSDESVLTVSAAGEINVMGLGVSTITVRLKNDSNIMYAFDIAVIDGKLSDALSETFTTAKILAGNCVGKMKIVGSNLTSIELVTTSAKKSLVIGGNSSTANNSFIVINATNLVAGNYYTVKIEYEILDGTHTFDVYRFDVATTENGQNGLYETTFFANSTTYKLKIFSQEKAMYQLKINSICFELSNADNIVGGEDVFE